MNCNELPIEQLVAHADGELTGAAADDAARHVASCAGCAHEVALLRRTADLIADLPGHQPGPEFARGVMDAVGDGGAAERADAGATSGRSPTLRLWPAAAAAAAVLVAAVAGRVWLSSPADDGRAGAELAAGEAAEIAQDLYLLANLEALERAGPDELIALVENLDILEGTEPEVTGMFAAAPDADVSGTESGERR